MVPPLVLDPAPGELVLDLTAAPGSKTTQMACLMGGTGRIVANDNNRVRYFKLKANVERQGAANVEVLCRYGESLGRLYPERFDRVLVDAPCSAEGRFCLDKPASYRYWRPGKIREMMRKQRRLLASGLEALRSGGVLVYATCTFAPEENEGIVHWALQEFSGAVAVEPVSVALPNRIAGLTGWDGMTFEAALRRTVRLLPTATMEAFYIARLRKL
jgi:16S rRNA (cytosine1407-C5)-methyltransferase